MLHYLDVMIGFAFTMLVISLTVTAMVQAVPVYLRNLKGASLQHGLAQMLIRIEPTLERHAGLVVDRLLRDPLLTPPRNIVLRLIARLPFLNAVRPILMHSRSSVVQREEFVRLLLDFAGQDGTGDSKAVAEARAAVKAMLAKAGISDPVAALANLRNRVAELERDNPTMSSSARASQAMLEVFLTDGGGKAFMARLVGWYDQTIDRVSAAYTARVRVWTVMLSGLLAVVLQLDTFALIARLNAEPELRGAIVNSAVAAMEANRLQPGTSDETAAMVCAQAHLVNPARLAADRLLAASAAGAPPPPAAPPATKAPPGPGPATRAGYGLSAYADCMGLKEATDTELVRWPENAASWWAQWKPQGLGLFMQLLGLVLSVSLLSLGAPFWYESLSNLIKLRSTITRTDAAGRQERQTAQTAG
ncbi:MAG: hypothetical protein WCO11_00750 [Sphingomonadales bacterium]|jgi:hypothetical protein